MTLTGDGDGWRSIHGWWSPACHQYLGRVVDELPPDAVVAEVGCWMGRSAASMLTQLRDAGRDDVTLVCVDTWEGTPPESDAGHHRRLLDDWGGDLLHAFNDNLDRLGLMSTQVRTRRADGAEYAATQPDRSFDFVLIDADHRRDMVRRDVEAWWPKVRPGGVLAGHDADAERVVAGVRDAGLEPVVEGQLWRVRRRVAVSVGHPAMMLATGPLRYALYGPHHGDATGHFGLDLTHDLRRTLGRCYTDRPPADDTPYTVVDHCRSGYLPSGAVVLCPCDRHDELRARDDLRVVRRSARPGEAVFPAWPHGPWPFLRRSWTPPPLGVSARPSVGFCGVTHRPAERRDAVDALVASTDVTADVVPRQRFVGGELLRDLARVEYLEVLLRNPYQLCPVGVGRFCYRLFETLAVGRIPVIIHPRELPLTDRLPWDRMAVHVPEDRVHDVGGHVLRYQERVVASSRGFGEVFADNRRLWWEYLTPHGWWREYAAEVERWAAR